MKNIYTSFTGMLGLSAFCACILALTSSSLAQNVNSPNYQDNACGTWTNDVWVPNGSCTPDNTNRRHGSIGGQITSVNGNMITVSQSNGSMQINDQPALDRQQSGRVSVGRQVVAYGYWLGGTFYATSIY